jgi:hypothetical protein
MLPKCLLASLGIAALVTAALPAEFYIAQDATTKQCTIAERPPSQGVGIVVGDGVYGDRGTAEAEMKTIHACISQATESGTRTQDTNTPALSR